MNLKFSKSQRLRKRGEYLRLMRSGQRLVGNLLCMDYIFEKKSITKLGITISAKFGKANIRNQTKRKIKEIIRKNTPNLPKHMLIHIIPRARIKSAMTPSIQNEILTLIAKAQKDHAQCSAEKSC